MLILLATEACGNRPGTAAEPWTRAAARPADTLPSAAAAAPASDRLLGVPIYPEARQAIDLRRSMETAWEEAGEPATLFDARLGEAILWTDDPWEDVAAFYRPLAARIMMDHEMEFPDIGTQKMLTGLLEASDGSIVKFTATRPFFRYPDQERIDRTVIQMGRLVDARAGALLAPSRHDRSHSAERGSHVH